MRLLRLVAVLAVTGALLTACGGSQQRQDRTGSVTRTRGRPSLERRRGRPKAGPADVIASGRGALLAQVERAYRDVPGVELTAGTGSASAGSRARRFLLALHDGTVSAEEFVGPGLLLVAREGSPTFVRTIGATCWRPLRDSTKRSILKSLHTPAGSLRRLERSNPRTLLNVGYWFPDEGKALPLRTKAGVQGLEIETHDAFWYLAGTASPSRPATKSFLTIAPNPHSHRIAAIQVRAPEPAVRATLGVRPLTTHPSIPRPSPTC